MEFAFTDEQVMIADTVRTFFAESAASDRTRAAMASDGFDRDTWQAFCGELGLAGIGIPEEFGGAGLGMVEFAIVAEAAGAQVAAIPLLGLASGARALAAGGSERQRAEWISPLLAGDAVAAAAEADAIRFDGGKLSGTVDFVPHGAVADVFILVTLGRAWLVRRDSPGVDAEGLTTMDQTRPLARIRLDGALAEPLADAAAASLALRQGAWLCLAAEALGGAQAALDRTVGYAKERVQFGRQIGSFQAFKHRLADMMIEVEQARSAVYWAACAIDEGSDNAALALHAAKSFCADTYRMCAGNMIQLHGGIGFTWEHDAHLFFKRARSIGSMFGDGDWHREQVARLTMGAAA